MHAYDELYVSAAQRRLGSMLDFAVNGRQCELDEFYQVFLASSISRAFERGNPRVVAGKSGIELALEVLGESELCEYEPLGESSPEFWAGWALAYYQWESARSFASIEAAVPVMQVLSMYHPFHEQDISSFCAKTESLYHQAFPQTALQRLRQEAGMSQSQLARASGIPLRTLQQYEQRQKAIDKAQVTYVLQLARVLHCDPESLLEHSHMSRYEYATVSL